MKIPGGFKPKISGKPKKTVEQSSFPEKLTLSLRRGELLYTPVVENKQEVQFGDPLAEVSISGGTLTLPAPASGVVTLSEGKDETGTIVLETKGSGAETAVLTTHKPGRISGREMRAALAKAGIWPFFWSAINKGVPPLDGSQAPRAIIVNCILTEPFRARGDVILSHSWKAIIEGIKFLPVLLKDYGTVEIVLTAWKDPLVQRMYAELKGFAWLHFHAVPIKYPVENPTVLYQAFHRENRGLSKEEAVWIIDIQGVEALGSCLDQGLPLHKRMVALGGPGQSNPRHVSARIGTPLKSLVREATPAGSVRVLRGGLLQGSPVDTENDAVNFDDDSFFFLPEQTKRELLGFLRPGFNKSSFLPAFATALTGGKDKHISASLRGEVRPCIGCGSCEQVCPVRLLPQVLHRYLYREALDEAEAAGLNLCVDCNLCSYVCTSKIDLQKQFAHAREIIKKEHEEVSTLNSNNNQVDG